MKEANDSERGQQYEQGCVVKIEVVNAIVADIRAAISEDLSRKQSRLTSMVNSRSCNNASRVCRASLAELAAGAPNQL